MTGDNRLSWVPLLILGLPGLLVTMDLTVLFLAIPQLTADLGPSGTELLWISDIYGFMIACALLVAGALGDRLGRRRVLLLGAAGFAVASVLASVAWSPETLIVARGLQGMAGAALGPLLGGGLLEVFDWRPVFVPNVPIMLALLLLAPRHLPEARTGAGRVDVTSAALSVAGLLALVYGIKSAERVQRGRPAGWPAGQPAVAAA